MPPKGVSRSRRRAAAAARCSPSSFPREIILGSRVRHASIIAAMIVALALVRTGSAQEAALAQFAGGSARPGQRHTSACRHPTSSMMEIRPADRRPRTGYASWSCGSKSNGRSARDYASILIADSPPRRKRLRRSGHPTSLAACWGWCRFGTTAWNSVRRITTTIFTSAGEPRSISSICRALIPPTRWSTRSSVPTTACNRRSTSGAGGCGRKGRCTSCSTGASSTTSSTTRWCKPRTPRRRKFPTAITPTTARRSARWKHRRPTFLRRPICGGTCASSPSSATSRSAIKRSRSRWSACKAAVTSTSWNAITARTRSSRPTPTASLPGYKPGIGPRTGGRPIPMAFSST